MSLKVNTCYMSRYSGREFKWDGEQVWTRLPGDIWRLADGWPQPSMSKNDLEYYVNKGEFYEAD